MLCQIHNVEFKLVPAGVSKTTGNPYKAFWACPERGCKQRPPVNAQGQEPKPRPVDKFAAGLDKDKEELKWQEIGAQKNRSNLAASFLQSGEELTPKALRKLALLEGWVLNGKIEVQPAKPTASVAAPAKPLKDKIADDPRFQEKPPKPKTEAELRAEGDKVFEQLAGTVDDVSDVPF